METRSLQIELQDEAMLAAIDRAIALLQRPSELMEDIGARIEASAAQRFVTKTDPTGQPWAPLSPATIEIYESEWFIKRNPEFAGGIPGSLLERTRRLLESLAHNTGADYVEIGTTRPTNNGRWQVGTLHEWGTKKMPRRGILTANPETGELGAADQADVLDIVGRFIGDAFAGL